MTKIEHFYQNVPGFAAFIDLYRSVAADAKDGQKFVEVGSWLGKSAAFMAVELINRGVDVEFVCVDPWKDGGPDLRNSNHFKSLGVQDVYGLFLENTKPVADRIKPYRMLSVDAAKLYEDHSVDFVMLDGDHSYDAIRTDIDAWLPKMKPGGLMSGDDFMWPGVEKAATETFGDRLHFRIKGGNRQNYLKSSSYWWVRT